MSRRPRMFLAALLLGAARAESEALWYWPALDTPFLPETTQHLDSLRKPVSENQTMVSVFSGHDAHLAVARDGRVLGVVELERRERRRYFHPGSGFDDDADGAWARALRDARRLAGVEVFDVGVYVAVPTAVFPSALASIARDWYAADHHASHASLAYYDALSRGYVWPLVLSYDGGGNDGFFAVFEPTGDLSRPLRRLDASNRRWERLNLGNGYALVAELIPEVAKCAPRNRRDNPGVEAYCRNRTASQRDREHLAGPGKMNGYASLGTPNEHDVSLLTQNIRDALKISLQSLDVDYADIAASAQRAFEEIVADEIRGALELAGRRPDALAVAGGCALNVGCNTALHRALALPVTIPAAPSDCGIGVGALYSAQPPPLDAPRDLMFAGPGLFDLDDLPSLAADRRAEIFTDDHALANKVAQLVAAGAIVGIARGRSEHGPRALGHRSLFADATSPRAKARLNRLKYREAWRPVAPIVAAAAAPALFEAGEHWRSPHMSVAPRFTPEACAQLPAVCHVDGTARLQSLERVDEPWVYAVLEALAELTGEPVVCNTSFNRRGEPILNTAAEALSLLCEEPELGYVVVEDALFEKCAACPGACSDPRDDL